MLLPDDEPCCSPFWARVCFAIGPALVVAVLFVVIFAPVLVLVVQEEPPLPPHVEVVETFWKFSSSQDTAAPFNSTVCVVYEPQGNETVEPECSRAPLNANEFSKLGDYFVAHTECRHHQEVLEGKCRVLEIHPHKVKPRLVMRGRHRGSMLCQWFVSKRTKELVVAVEVTCR